MLPVGCWFWWLPLQRVLTVASPKSPIFTVPSSVRNMLFVFKSLKWQLLENKVRSPKSKALSRQDMNLRYTGHSIAPIQLATKQASDGRTFIRIYAAHHYTRPLTPTQQTRSCKGMLRLKSLWQRARVTSTSTFHHMKEKRTLRPIRQAASFFSSFCKEFCTHFKCPHNSMWTQLMHDANMDEKHSCNRPHTKMPANQVPFEMNVREKIYTAQLSATKTFYGTVACSAKDLK